VLCRKSQARCKIFGRSLAPGTFLRAASSSGIYCKRTKSEIPESAERQAGVAIGSLIMRKITEFANPVDPRGEQRLRSTREPNRAPQATKQMRSRPATWTALFSRNVLSPISTHEAWGSSSLTCAPKSARKTMPLGRHDLRSKLRRSICSTSVAGGQSCRVWRTL